MVNLVLETGSGVLGANSYASVAYADDYFSVHPFYSDAWDELSGSTKAALLISASRMLDVQYNWYGYGSTQTQGLAWPRTGVRDGYDILLGGYAVPERLRQATCEQAYYLTKGDKSPESATSSGIDKLKIDVIELEFSSSTSISASAFAAVPSTVRALLRGLGDYSSGFRVRKLLVG